MAGSRSSLRAAASGQHKFPSNKAISQKFYLVLGRQRQSDGCPYFSYIARDVPIYAEQFIDRIINTVDLLHEQPLMGREVPEAERKDVRELIFQNYRIIYLVRPDYLYIVAVVHGSRDLTRMESKPWELI